MRCLCDPTKLFGACNHTNEAQFITLATIYLFIISTTPNMAIQMHLSPVPCNLVVIREHRVIDHCVIDIRAPILGDFLWQKGQKGETDAVFLLATFDRMATKITIYPFKQLMTKASHSIVLSLLKLLPLKPLKSSGIARQIQVFQSILLKPFSRWWLLYPLLSSVHPSPIWLAQRANSLF